MPEQPKASILFVDDDLDLLQILQERFISLGYTVRTAQTGDDALEFARSMSFDVAILDIHMPKMNGFSLVDELRKTLPELKVIFLTGSRSKTTILKTLEKKADALLEKPFDYRDLDRAICRIVQSRTNAVLKRA